MRHARESGQVVFAGSSLAGNPLTRPDGSCERPLRCLRRGAFTTPAGLEPVGASEAACSRRGSCWRLTVL